MLQHGIYDKPKLRKTVEGILYRMRTGLPWRDLPSFFGVCISIYQQFNRWSSKNKLMDIFKSLVQDPDFEWEFVDGSIVKAHQTAPVQLVRMMKRLVNLSLEIRQKFTWRPMHMACQLIL